MRTFLDLLRTGDWLTRDRIRAWSSVFLLVLAATIAFVIATANGINDYQGRPIGTDFSHVYAAGTYVLEGHPDKPYDNPSLHAREQQIFGPATPFYGWIYPPFFLFIAAALATMPYLVALAVWQGATLALYLLAVRAVLRHPATSPATPAAESPALSSDRMWLLVTLAYTAVFVNVTHGHNGFLTAALFAGGLVLLDGRPAVAGVLFGLMAYKPQFGLLIPLVLIATFRWRAVAAATATVMVLIFVSTAAFGPEVWGAFAAGSSFTRTIVLEQGGPGWEKIQSVFSWVRMWGGTIAMAYAVQAIATVMIATAAVWLWRSRAPYALKASALMVAAILATPYSLDYDMMVLGPAIAYLAKDGALRGFQPYEKTALAVFWFVPIIARTITHATFIPVGAIAMLAMFALILRRAASGKHAFPRSVAASSLR